MIIRDEMRVERTNIIFGLRANNTDLGAVRIKLGRLGGEGRGGGSTRAGCRGLYRALLLGTAKTSDGSSSGLDFCHSCAVTRGGPRVSGGAARGKQDRRAGGQPQSTAEKPRGPFPL